MDRLSTFAALVVATIVTTIMMFLTALIVWVLGPAAIYFVWIVCIPLECILLFLDLVLLWVSLSTALHLLRLWRENEEHRIKSLRKRREMDLEMRRLQLIECQRRIRRGGYLSRRAQLQKRPSNSLYER